MICESLIVAQSAQQLAQRGRLFEYLGYFLIALVVVILLAGVLWSLRKRFEGVSRTTYLVISGVGLLLVTAGVAVSLMLMFVLTMPASPLPPRINVTQQPLLPAQVGLDVQASVDGTIAVGDREFPREEFESFLSAQVDSWKEEGIALDRVTIHFHCDPEMQHGQLIQLIDVTQRLGIASFTINVNDETPDAENPAEP